jgi:transglutaminase-like putative cysteine protease
VIYDVRHVTTYTYGSPVTFAQCTLRMLPTDGHGQAVLWRELAIEPQPAARTDHISFFGETVALAQIDTPHKVLRIEAKSRVDVRRRRIAPDRRGLAWEEVREQAFAIQSLAPRSPAHFLFPTSRTPFSPAVTAYVRCSFPNRRPVVEGARELIGRIRREFRYDPDATRVSTPLVEAFEARHGVCQDYAHIMIAGLRGLGLPAAYVSGYIRTVPLDGKARLEGSDASHAWVALWCGEADGWLGFDPTNNTVENDDHVVLGWGRDYTEVAPLGGILQGTNEQKVTVAVDVIPVLHP